ncbi:Protein sprT [Vibrio nigripulchritudo MADA3029]|uniref:SprT family zinc-dependent metalloprotease n=1 Tax=Vibrio nigripulchritudo TaxID=28173 RepID=UPI0003B18438|nr:SprT family zinc-dependent metalloprotease [Vibrio nigripulchritudo]CCN48063.1 Protein sprT [Vibrio nigripulchritudo MADA3020]CCN52562.1 Protein sprT [Vibrio nigripulchritudo MADA3021]CCN60065.1 Protein sprT [Vibrio nigripulchritudo MADA3029]
MLNPTTSYTIDQIIRRCIRQAENKFGCSFPVPVWNFNVRGKAAGKAYLQSWEIRLNPTLFAGNQEAFYKEVIPHEVAHLITYQQFGRVKPHGAEWQYVMEEVLGVKANTTHQFDVKDVQGKTFEYRCECQVHALTIRRHNKIQRGQTSYQCRSCKGELKFTGTQLS